MWNWLSGVRFLHVGRWKCRLPRVLRTQMVLLSYLSLWRLLMVYVCKDTKHIGFKQGCLKQCCLKWYWGRNVMSVHDCLVGAAETAAPPGRTPIKNLPQISQMRTDQEGMASWSVRICEICGRISCARSFCEFCEFCGRIGRGRRGYGRMPYPPTKTPTDCTDVHRLGGKNAT